ncbi:MAG: DUF368 domain-containing protein, partial [Bacteroidales bacterium]
FFALISASSIIILKEVDFLKFKNSSSLLIGVLMALFISLATPAESSEALWFIFLSGVIAICAMILPGISGSFILLLMGKYSYMIAALKELNISVIVVFGLGAALGLILFSRFLSWLLKSYYQQTISALAGFMVGSLVKVWPWRVGRGGVIDGFDYPALPKQYSEATGNNPQLLAALLFFLLGLLLVYGVEVARKKRETK